MDIAKLLKLAERFADVPEIILAAGMVSSDIISLIERIRDNHARSVAVLTAGDAAELAAIHHETLAMIDAFDAELAKAAAR